MSLVREAIQFGRRVVSATASSVTGALHGVDREIYFWNRYPLPLRSRLRAWRHGFLSRAYFMLGLDERDPTDYLSDYQQFRFVRPAVNTGYSDVLEHKLAFHLASSPELDAVPELYATISDGSLYLCEEATSLSELCDAHGALVVKPNTGTKGQGVRLVRRVDDGYVVNGEPVTADGLDELARDLDQMVVTEFVDQHDYSDRIWSRSTNTIRALTVRDPDTGEFFVAKAVHRFGNEGTGPTDNWSDGGVAAPVDVATGELGQIVEYQTGNGATCYERHPGSNVTVEGQVIPDWDAVTDVVLEVAAHHRSAPYVGWDIVQTADGPIVLEGNCAPGITSLQLSGGILEDERVRRVIGCD